ncbi:signal peptidase I [Methanomassiliicoccus luminyensis]|uniref:signal peptidase I n=1 Tax=Methanomassiliicoccus luminyensis TaxID=1080712 RepID=UPI00164E3A3A|nr:signal peptidase I [Methanomassiliicoccus luminyensis]
MNKRLSQLGTVVVVVLLAIALTGLLAPIFGYRLDVVQSGSMEPNIGVGDLVITAPEEFSDIRTGDVISFRSPDNGVLICHRVVGVDESNSTLQTKGDANEDNDPYVLKEQHVVGKVVANIPLMGYAVDFLKTPFGWAVIIMLFALVLVMGNDKGAKGGKDSDSSAVETTKKDDA